MPLQIQKPISTLHLICGLPASGKSTYAQQLAKQTKGVVLSLDYWLQMSFGQYVIDEVGHSEHIRRVRACRELIKEVSQEFLSQEIEVILDDGFFLQADRQEYRLWAAAVSAKTVIHFLNPELEVIKSRITTRNADLPDHNFMITDQVLAEMIAMFEAPTMDEGKVLTISS